ncbi:MAG: DUF1987 domain-containing protein [Bacteroidetes bacterium]|nr:MAG: DUF1987 domain-containing protein [Bacteroidota bacterium]
MKPLNIKNDVINPGFYYSPETNVLTIYGHSVPENARRVYEPAIEWAKEYQHPGKPFKVELKVDYFNSSSFAQLVTLLEILKEKTDFTVDFYYEDDDEDMLIIADDIRIMLDVEVNTFPVDEENFLDEWNI